MFRRISVPEIVAAALALVLFLAAVTGGHFMLSQLVVILGTMTISALHLVMLRAKLRKGVPAMAEVVDYSVKTKRTRHRFAPDEVYQVWAPIVEYETTEGTIRTRYPVYSREYWFRQGDVYPICYAMDDPELFYFTDRAGERTSLWESLLLVMVIVGAAYIIMWAAKA